MTMVKICDKCGSSANALGGGGSVAILPKDVGGTPSSVREYDLCVSCADEIEELIRNND